MDKNARKLCLVKTFQKIYQEQFGEKLIVDFPAMKGVVEERRMVNTTNIKEMQEFLSECVKKHGASKKKLLTSGNMRNNHERIKEVKALREYAIHAVRENWDMKKACKVVNRERIALYQMAKKWK